jgi:hypothetical protein
MNSRRRLITELPLAQALRVVWRRLSIVLATAVVCLIAFWTHLFARGDLLSKPYVLSVVFALATYFLVDFLHKVIATLILFFRTARKHGGMLVVFQQLRSLWSLIEGAALLNTLTRHEKRKD